jgi:hypothetical protein
MTHHRHHRMHANSLHTYALTDFGPRERAILAVYTASSVPLTDREVKDRLGLSDMNSVRPRISTLIELGYLHEQQAVECPVTGKDVRTVRLAVPIQQAVA